MRRSPGKSGLAISATASGRGSTGLNSAGRASSGCFSSLRMSVLFSAEIQSSDAGSRSSRMRADVSMPRSPTHQRHPLDPEPLPDARDLPGHRGRIAGVAGKHLHGDRATVPCAQQAEGDLLLALLAVPVVAELRQRTLSPLEVAGTDVVQNQCLSAKVPVRQALLDPGLAIEQPVEHREHLVAADRFVSRNVSAVVGRSVADCSGYGFWWTATNPVRSRGGFLSKQAISEEAASGEADSV